MAFITNISGDVISFADAQDVRNIDQRVFEGNEIRFDDAGTGATTLDEYLDDLCERSTTRILQRLKASTWWQSYNAYVNNPISDLANLPDVDPNRVKGRQAAFTDMTVYYCLKEYLLPKVADFAGGLDNPEVQKITYYENKFNDLFNELTSLADWYDFDDSGTVDADEKAISYFRTRRTRRRATLVKVR